MTEIIIAPLYVYIRPAEGLVNILLWYWGRGGEATVFQWSSHNTELQSFGFPLLLATQNTVL